MDVRLGDASAGRRDANSGCAAMAFCGTVLLCMAVGEFTTLLLVWRPIKVQMQVARRATWLVGAKRQETAPATQHTVTLWAARP